MARRGERLRAGSRRFLDVRRAGPARCPPPARAQAPIRRCSPPAVSSVTEIETLCATPTRSFARPVLWPRRARGIAVQPGSAGSAGRSSTTPWREFVEAFPDLPAPGVAAQRLRQIGPRPVRAAGGRLSGDAAAEWWPRFETGGSSEYLVALGIRAAARSSPTSPSSGPASPSSPTRRGDLPHLIRARTTESRRRKGRDGRPSSTTRPARRPRPRMVFRRPLLAAADAGGRDADGRRLHRRAGGAEGRRSCSTCTHRAARRPSSPARSSRRRRADGEPAEERQRGRIWSRKHLARLKGLVAGRFMKRVNTAYVSRPLSAIRTAAFSAYVITWRG